MKSKILKTFIVVPGKKYYFFNKINEEDLIIEEEPFISEKNTSLRYLKRGVKKVGLWRVYKTFLHRWRSELDQCDKCIIFDQAFSTSIVKVIYSFNPSIKIFVYLWNPVFKNPRIVNKLKKVERYIKIYSFDKNDCKKYNFNFAPMVYSKQGLKVEDGKYDYDVIFVGYAKDRIVLLKEIYEYLNKNRLSSFFYVVGDNVESMPFDLHKTYLDYEIYSEKLSKSRVVLDVVQSGQIGLTIRTLETLFMGKKLITTNRDIKNYNFYDSSNIFILGEDSLDKLGDFIISAFSNIGSNIIDQYDFRNWINRFE